MAPDELKVQKRKTAINQWRQYTEQTKEETNTTSRVSAVSGTMAGKWSKLDISVKSSTRPEAVKDQDCITTAKKANMRSQVFYKNE